MSFTILCGPHAREERAINPNWIGDQQLGHIFNDHLGEGIMDLTREEQYALIAKTEQAWHCFLAVFDGNSDQTFEEAYDVLIQASEL